MPFERTTGKNRGYALVKYEDKKSLELAVDNMRGSVCADAL